MFAAIAGQGGIAKLVKLPHEGHGYKARESIMHTLAEQHEWLTRWVVNKEEKPAKPKKAMPADTGGNGVGTRTSCLASIIATFTFGLISYKRSRM